MWPAIAAMLVTAFVGAQNCKLCHRPIYVSWSATRHAHATERLAPADRTAECLRCHATGLPALPGVQCEACHGAGGNYWPAQIMMDREKATSAGLVRPGEEVCRSCHGTGIAGHRSDFTLPGADHRARAIH